MRMLLFFFIAIFILIFFGKNYYFSSPSHTSKASAIVYPTKGNTVTGTVSFEQQSNGLHINAQLQGLTPGKHGFHVHEYGNCACDDGVCAGDHYNPTNKPHGSPNSTERHVGDFGNIIADDQGKASYSAVDMHATLNGPHSIIGRSVIIHAQEDDLTSQPSGNAGARIGCGVIGIAKN